MTKGSKDPCRNSAGCNFRVTHCRLMMRLNPFFSRLLLHLAVSVYVIFCVGLCPIHVVCRHCVRQEIEEFLCPGCVRA